jgi:uncharacterized protein YbjT (DUF2867 family)
MSMEILVLGGTGLAGRAVCEEAQTRGHGVRLLARHRPAGADGGAAHLGDTVTGAGLEEAMAGVAAVVDCTNIQSLDREKASAFFVGSVRNAAAAAVARGVRSFVLLSIVGVDRMPLGYYQAKLVQERALLAATSGTTVSPVVARTTQFHDFAAQTLARGGFGPFAFVPSMRIRPVDLRAVARHLVDTAEQAPAPRAPELAGPREERLPDMVRRFRSVSGSGRVIVPVPIPGRAGRAIREGLLIPDGGVTDAVTFDDWLTGVEVSA